MLEHRFEAGELEGHAFGNLLIVALAEVAGSFVEGIAAAAEVLDADGRVLPATSAGVVLKAQAAEGELIGQALITRSQSIATISIDPADAPSPAAVPAAILAADQIVLGPGSLYTSVLAATVVPAVHEALALTSATIVYVANLRQQHPETAGFDVAHLVEALCAHGVCPNVVLADPSALPLGAPRGDVPVVTAPVAAEHLSVHDPDRLAAELARLAAASACGRRER